jgi:hypothetical protein
METFSEFVSDQIPIEQMFDYVQALKKYVEGQMADLPFEEKPVEKWAKPVDLHLRKSLKI